MPGVHTPGVPLLPGNEVYAATDWPRKRPQLMRYINGVPVFTDQLYTAELARSAPAALPPIPPDSHRHSQHELPLERGREGGASTSGRGPEKLHLPAWLAYDRVVCRYFAYFEEAVDRSNSRETWRVRPVEIHFHLADGTLQVTEHRVDNSGLLQGAFLHRHRVKKACGAYVGLADLRVGEALTLYARCFHIVGADPFTRALAAEQGITLKANQPCPEDEFTREGRQRRAYEEAQHRRALLAPPGGGEEELSFGAAALPGAQDRLTQRRFYLDDRKVLRFYACWDDRDTLYGDLRLCTLAYHLADDTMEVTEQLPRNCGRIPFPKLLSRRRLPKGVPPTGIRPLSASARLADGTQYYHWRELRIGGALSVYGRTLSIYDCDDFTRSIYRERLGLHEYELAPLPLDLPKPEAPEVAVPPNTSGIGSEEDSLQNVFHLQPKPPRIDFTHFVEFDGKVLRYTGVILPGPKTLPAQAAVDASRSFVVSLYMADSSIAVYEPPQPNTGVVGGRFLERHKVPKGPGQGYLGAHDLFIGARLELSGRTFLLTDADEYTLKYLTAYRRTFPLADSDAVLARLRGALAAAGPQGLPSLREALLAAGGADACGAVTNDTLQGVLLTTLGLALTAHELVTLARRLRPEGSTGHKAVPLLPLLDALQE